MKLKSAGLKNVQVQLIMQGRLTLEKKCLGAIQLMLVCKYSVK